MSWDDGVASFDWTDGVHDIVSWLLRPSAAPAYLLEIQYGVYAFADTTLEPSQRPVLMRLLVASLEVGPG